MTGDKS